MTASHLSIMTTFDVVNNEHLKMQRTLVMSMKIQFKVSKSLRKGFSRHSVLMKMNE